jgi:hypothetical protein
VGASPNDPWIVWTAEAEPYGREADLVRRFAASLDVFVRRLACLDATAFHVSIGVGVDSVRSLESGGDKGGVERN